MNVESSNANRQGRNGSVFPDGLVAFAATAALLLAPMAVHAGGSGSSGSGTGSTAVKFEEIPGSALKRVILTEKAAERLGIETDQVREQSIVRKQMFGGQVSHPLRIEMERKQAVGAFGGFSEVAAASTTPAVVQSAPTDGEAWIRLTLSEDEWDRVAKDQPARVLPLTTREKSTKELVAVPSSLPPLEDPKRTMLTLHYVVTDKDHDLNANHRMRVELTLKGSDEKHKVVPYSALYYDGQGVPWVYVETQPLTYERAPVTVERIEDEIVILTEGPDMGTRVVTVGAALLYGAEVIFKK